MVWPFKSKNASKSKGKKSRSRPRSAKKPDASSRRGQWLKGARVAAIVAVVGALGYGWFWGRGALQAYADRQLDVAPTPKHVELHGAEGLSEWVAADLRTLVANALTADAFDVAALQRAAFLLSADPWVRSVEQVRRRPGPTIDVYATYRKPLALIDSAGVYAMVDSECVRLPGRYLDHQLETLGLPVVIGVKTQAPAPGEPWIGPGAPAALRLVELLKGEPYADQILAYDVSQRDERGRVVAVLHTPQKGVVVWGLTPGEELGIEPEAVIKRKHLNDLYLEYGAIDAHGRVVKIYGPQVYVGPAADAATAGG